ncbi:hypothetical protein, partial [Chromatium okenii]|uniref:ADP-ribosyltransferase-containing protein n=1 Tax=Chromatium okenii TaxID=61644 RepID=UPI0026EE5864
ITNKYKRKEYTEEERASQKKYRLTNFERERSKIDALQEELGFTLLDESDDFLLYSKFEGSSQHLIQYSLVSKNMSPPIGSMFVFEGSGKVLASRLSYYKTAREIYGKDKATDMMDKVDDKQVLEALDDKIGRGLFFPEDSNVYNLLRRMTSSSLDSIDPLETQEGRTKQIENMLKGKIVSKSNVKFSKAKAQERLAPNGKPSNLNATQYEQVRTPEFKAWFGDWENDPENASKVVDENGEPLVAYHATGDTFTEFDTNKTQDSLFWFTSDIDNIANVGAANTKNIMPVFLNIKTLAGWDEYDNLNTDQIIAKDFDGIQLDEDFVAFNPNQIKSATGNTGEFSKESNDIRFSKARVSKSDDAKYLAAVEAGDMETAQEMVNLAAENAGYGMSDYQMSHEAPNRNDYPINDLTTIYPEDIYSSSAVNYYGDGQSSDSEAMAKLQRMRGKKPNAAIMVYRAVPNDVKESMPRNGDWVSTTRAYAEEHGKRWLPNGYRVMEIVTTVGNIFTDGNSIHELGFDDGKEYGYANTKNNRKLIDAVTYDDDANVIPLSKRFNKRSDDVRFSKAAKKVLDDNPLAIVHNLSVKNLVHADKMGGLPAPSIAVVNQKYPLSGFGEITLIGDTSQFAPEADKANRFYNADVYSPRYPSVTYIVDSKAVSNANESLSDDAKVLAKVIGYRGTINASSIEDRGLVQGLADNVTLKYEFLKSIGKAPKMQYKVNKLPPANMKKFVTSNTPSMELSKDPAFVQAVVDTYNESVRKRNETLNQNRPYLEVESQQASNLAFDYQYAIEEFRNQKGKPKSIDDYATSKLIREKTNQAQYEKWLVENYSNLITDERIFNGFTNAGNRIYLPHNLDTVVKLMTKTVKGGENVSYGIGTIRAYTAKQFKTVKAIQAARGDIVSAEKLEALKKELSNEFENLSEELRPYSDYSNPSATDALSDLVSKGTRAFKESYQDVPAETMTKVYDFLDKLKNMPAHYFEGKIGRAVKLNEFAGALVPKGKEYDEAVKILNANGVTKIKRYTENDSQSRSDALLNFSELLFSQTQEPTADNHTEQSLKEGLTQAGDNAYGKGWTDRLLATGMFEFISDADAQAIVEEAAEVSYSKNGDIEAFFNPAEGKTYFVSENISKDKDLHYLMMHEVSVHMLNMGENKTEFEKFLKATDNLVKVKNPAALKGRQDALDADTPQEDLREETLAYLVKYVPKLKVVQQFKAWLKNALRNMSKMFPASQRLGFIQWANNLSDQDLLYIANVTLRKAPEMLGVTGQNVKFKTNSFELLYLIRIRVLMDRVREQGGKVDESNDVVLAMEAAGNIAANQLEKLKERYIQPLIDRMAKMNVNKDEIGLLLYAKHAPERNAYIQSINPKFRKLGEGGSGMTDKESAAIIQRYKDTM